MKVLFFSLAALPLLAACASVGAAPTTPSTHKAFVIRHLQKGDGSDPSLTAAGQANALLLAERLKGENIVAAYATDTRRAQETGQPVATASGIAVTSYPPTDIDGLAARVAASNGSVLIVGHSNTVPMIVTRLSGKPQAPIDESRYGDLYVVDLSSQTVTVEHIGD